MKRSQFCKSFVNTGIACSCALGINAGGLFDSFRPSGSNNPSGPTGTSCDARMDFTRKWVKRFFEIMDQQIDEKTRTALMQTNGAACAKGAYGELTNAGEASLEEIDDTIGKWQAKIGKENIYRQGGTVYFSYTGNPGGLKISDGYCLCPMVEDGPATLSPTFCQCSVGYVRYMFQRLITFKPVEVELLESLRGGGKRCSFKITL